MSVRKYTSSIRRLDTQAVLSVDLRDAVGDRLYLSNRFRREGTKFDIGQATTLKQHAAMLSAQQAVSQSRKSRGLFSAWRRSADQYRPTYNYQKDGSACRIYGTITAKKVTGECCALGSVFTKSLRPGTTNTGLDRQTHCSRMIWTNTVRLVSCARIESRLGHCTRPLLTAEQRSFVL